MSTIFTPPWTMGNGVGMGTSPNIDASIHGHRMSRIQRHLGEMVRTVLSYEGQHAAAELHSLNHKEALHLTTALIAELRDH